MLPRLKTSEFYLYDVNKSKFASSRDGNDFEVYDLLDLKNMVIVSNDFAKNEVG